MIPTMAMNEAVNVAKTGSKTTPRNSAEARMMRAVELVYGVEGVVASRVWETEEGVCVGVRIAPQENLFEVQRRVREAVLPLAREGESFFVGILEDG
jgi:hypothetical protein